MSKKKAEKGPDGDGYEYVTLPLDDSLVHMYPGSIILFAESVMKSGMPQDQMYDAIETAREFLRDYYS